MLSCEFCGESFERRSPNGPRPQYCSAYCRWTAARRRAEADGRSTAWTTTSKERRRRKPETVVCPQCGNGFTRPSRRQVYCSAPCRNRALYERRIADGRQAAMTERRRVEGQPTQPWSPRRRAYYDARRARKRATQVELIRAEDIFERDGWVCGICTEPVDRELQHPDPFSASLDHVVPLGAGGTHTEDNVQCSHLRCNLQKGTRVLAEVG